MTIDLETLRRTVNQDAASQTTSRPAQRQSSEGSSSIIEVAARWIKRGFVVLFVVSVAIALISLKSGPMSSKPSGSVADSSSTSSRSANELPGRLSVDEVAQAAHESIDEVLSIAHNGNNSDIQSAARQAGRTFDFSPYHPPRDRNRGRTLNEQALSAFYESRDPQRAYDIQRKAFDADPLSAEIAGNLAIYAFRIGHYSEASSYVLYALSLRRPAGRSGRTTDWATLAAIKAATGDVAGARDALYVTLAIAPDVEARCTSAKQSVNNTYGPVLRDATEAMFRRIQEQSLSQGAACATPIQW